MDGWMVYSIFFLSFLSLMYVLCCWRIRIIRISVYGVTHSFLYSMVFPSEQSIYRHIWWLYLCYFEEVNIDQSSKLAAYVVANKRRTWIQYLFLLYCNFLKSHNSILPTSQLNLKVALYDGIITVNVLSHMIYSYFLGLFLTFESISPSPTNKFLILSQNSKEHVLFFRCF